MIGREWRWAEYRRRVYLEPSQWTIHSFIYFRCIVKILRDFTRNGRNWIKNGKYHSWSRFLSVILSVLPQSLHHHLVMERVVPIQQMISLHSLVLPLIVVLPLEHSLNWLVDRLPLLLPRQHLAISWIHEWMNGIGIDCEWIPPLQYPRERLWEPSPSLLSHTKFTQIVSIDCTLAPKVVLPAFFHALISHVHSPLSRCFIRLHWEFSLFLSHPTQSFSPIIPIPFRCKTLSHCPLVSIPVHPSSLPNPLPPPSSLLHP